MSEDKTPIESTFVEVPPSPPVVPPKSHPYRKCVIIAVTGVVVAAVILTAILVGLYLFTEGQKEILKFSYNRDENAKEEVTSDLNTNIVQYHVTDTNYEMWVINDFNRDIQVMKIQADSGTDCYVAPLNRTIATDPDKVSAPSNIKKNNSQYSVTYRVPNSPIPDSSFLCTVAKNTCQGISTYWVYPACDIPKSPSDSSPRQKRGGGCDDCCCEYCISFICADVCWC